jgi:N-acetylneuraminate synthase
MRTAAHELIAGGRPDRCVVIAELGVNHNGSLERALRLVDAAHEAGADAVKLQLFEPGELCSRRYRADELELLARYKLSDRQHARIVRAAAQRGLPVFATAFDEPSLRLLEQLEIPLIKIGSGEVTHTPFLSAAARTGKPIILSTGGCELAEVDRAVEALRAGGCARPALLHCVSAYPPPDEQVHLRVLATLAQRYAGLTIGFSDHTLGLEAAVAAVALGARIIEKHLTLDRRDEGPDHAASAAPLGFAALVAAVRRVEAMLGRAEKVRWSCEGTIGRSIVAADDLPAGTVLTAADLAFKRPGDGLRPYAAARLIGKALRRAVARDEQITMADVELTRAGAAAPPARMKQGETGVAADFARKVASPRPSRA